MEQVIKLFKQRLDSTFHNHPDSKRIRLCVEKLLLESFDGSIEVESKEGVGALYCEIWKPGFQF